jgi:hypothetical protein
LENFEIGLYKERKDIAMTGQVVLRETGLVKDGKKVYMVFGVLGIPDDEARAFKGETKYTIQHLELVNPEDVKKITRGNTPDGLLKYPMWRV